MTHEAGIEAAMNRYDDCISTKCPPFTAVCSIIQAYVSVCGSVLVPKEPTEEMKKAGCIWEDDFYKHHAEAVYDSMIERAPSTFNIKAAIDRKRGI